MNYHPKHNWSNVPWHRTDSEIAMILDATPSTVRKKRKELGKPKVQSLGLGIYRRK